MRFAPLMAKITESRDEAQLRSRFMSEAGALAGATAWGIDLLDSRLQVIESDFWGISDAFCDRYQSIGRAIDGLSQRMLQQHIPVHQLSVYSLEEWHHSLLYREIFRPFELEHGMVAPLFGNGRLVGGVYFMRQKDLPTFDDDHLLQVSSLCQVLAVRLATFRMAIAPSLLNNLTPREVDVAELVAQGYSNRDIAAKLHISRDAVKQVLKRMFRKLDVSARAEMVAKLVTDYSG